MKVGIFSHGDIQYKKLNLWRETSFALHLIKQAVNTRLSLLKCITDWKDIANSLAENPRQRRPQIEKLSFLS